MASYKGRPVGDPWSRWNSGQGSTPGKRFTVTGVGKDQRDTSKLGSKPESKKK